MEVGALYPCMMCHQGTNWFLEEKIRKMEFLLRDVPKTEKETHFLWSFHSHCRYGLYCEKLRKFDSECEKRAKRLEGKLLTVALKYDDYKSLYHTILSLLRGDFPAVYREMEANKRWSMSL